MLKTVKAKINKKGEVRLLEPIKVDHEGKLVSIAKVKSDLSEEETREVSEFVKNNTLEKFGPVRTVKPELVFEIFFESISESKRHKSGVVLHLPGITRWKKDKRIDEVIFLENLKKLIL